MAKRILTALVLAGSLAMGTASVAGAAPAPNCTRVPAQIARLQADENRISAAITALQARVPRNSRDAARTKREIAFLTAVESGLGSRVSALQAACPTSAPTNV